MMEHDSPSIPLATDTSLRANAATSPSRHGLRRSCAACRRRKIRCDRAHPCGYCTKLHLQCAYPSIPSDGSKQVDLGLLSRLEQIEASLQRLESQNVSPANRQASQVPADTATAYTKSPPEAEHNSNPGSGRLVSEDGETRFVTSNFWTDLDKAENHSGSLLDELPPTLNSTLSKGSHPRQYRSLVFNSSRAAPEPSQLHPPEHHVFILWQVYLENVDPVLKMMHVPTTQRQIFRASQNLAQIPPAYECLMFSIYYAATISIQNPQSLRKLLQEERQVLLERFQLGVEQSLSKASFMTTPSITTLQALTIYLICARQSVDKAYIWSMTGLLIRLAMKLGLHRDPATLGLPPFSAEMRRRLWWHIATLDVRTAEENDMDPLIYEHMFDTKLPTNINDTDLDVNVTSLPEPIRQRSEMLYTLVRFEGSYAARKLVFSSKFSADNGYPGFSLQEKNDFVESISQDLTERYLKHCHNKIPICFLAVSSIQMVLAKVKLTINHSARTAYTSIYDSRLASLTESSIEVIEYAHTLRTSDEYGRWLWLFQKYIEWDAVAFLLHSLCALPNPRWLDRAWAALNNFFNTWEDSGLQGDRRWRRLKALRVKAISVQSLQKINPGDVATTLATHGDQTDIITTSQNFRSMPDERNLPDALTVDNQHHLQFPYEFFQQDFNQVSEQDFAEWGFGNVTCLVQDTTGSPGWDMEIGENVLS
ncbi:hypothetical protein RBB50_011441 [Rhinocladiella similis]